ncbi:MAG: 5-oxoprolinase subunit PxpB [Epsilonproteobacteria bacterium]|nr:5-oxoprolinase subunit PxpB [Campylobacterota bacterium]
MEFEPAGVDGVIIYFDDKIDEKTSLKIGFYYRSLKSLNDPDILSIIPSYTTLFIRYDLKRYDFTSFVNYIKDRFSRFKDNKDESKEQKRLIVPVYYDLEVGYDLQRVAKLNSITVDEVITLHSKREYLVYTIGFLPGFAYLGTVDEKIAAKRLEHPRDMIPKGSVAIADTQTAVYPKDSPGGWNIIGRTTLDMIDSKFNTIVQMGDIVKFEPVSKSEFLKNGGKI